VIFLKNKKVVVIGAGVAGLSAAIHLGFQPLVLEKSNVIGIPAKKPEIITKN